MKVVGKVSNSIPYKKTNCVNPEINQPPSHVKPIVVKQNNFDSNASMMAAIEEKKAEAMRRAQQQKIRSFQQNIKMNASRISEEKSIISINLKKQKQDAFQKQKSIKQQYTKIYSKNKNEDGIRQVMVKPETIEYYQEKEEEVEEPVRKNPSVKLLRQRSKSPMSPLGIDRSQISIPKYIEESSSSESDNVDSQNEGEDVESVMSNHMKIRKMMAKKLK